MASLAQTSDHQPRISKSTNKLRRACDRCHFAKIRCSGGSPCESCLENSKPCLRSLSNRLGRPKGTKNKRTRERDQQQLAADRDKITHVSDPMLSPIPSVESSSVTTVSSSPLLAPDDMFQLLHEQTWASDELYPDLSAETHPSWGFPADPVSAEFAEGQDHISAAEPQHNHANMAALQGEIEALLSASHDLEAIAHVSPAMMASQGGRCPAEASQREATESTAVSHSPLSQLFSQMEPAATILPTSTIDPPMCDCLQHQAELLCRLKKLGLGTAAPPLDAVLNGVDEASGHWTRFAHCKGCEHDGHQKQEVLLLAAMSIRVVLRLIQGVCFDYGLDNCWRDDDSFMQAGPTAALSQRITRVQVGSHDVVGEERVSILQFLISKALTKIQHALACLEKKSLPDSFHHTFVSSDVQVDDPGSRHVRALFQALKATLQNLFKTLKMGSQSGLDNFDSVI